MLASRARLMGSGKAPIYLREAGIVRNRSIGSR
jgi:hypothetical protein